MYYTKLSCRILAVLLSITLCVSLLPVTALAEDADAGAGNDAVTVDAAETDHEAPAEEAPAEEAEEAPAAEDYPAEEITEEATELDPGVPEAETLAEDGSEALTGTCGTNLTWTLADGTLTISGTGAMDDLSPAPWYSSRKEIQAVVLRSGVTSIGSYAFQGCVNLSSVTIPASVTGIGDWAFDSCSSLTSVSISAGVESIGVCAFGNCSSLAKIAVSTKNESFCSVGGVLFTKDKTTLVCCPAGKNGAYAIPAGVTSIRYGAFYACSSLTSISIPDSVTSLGEEVFTSCASLTEIAVSAENNTYCSAGGVLFTKDKATLIRYPSGKTGAYMVPGSVTRIDDLAFISSSIASIAIPDSVTSIGGQAFAYCRSLRDVYYSGTETGWDSIRISEGNECLTLANLTFGKIVAAIGTAWYVNLATATEAARPGDTVTLLADISSEPYVVVPAGVTLDLNGHSLTGATLLFVTGSLVDSGSTKGGFSARVYYLNYAEKVQFPVYNSATGTYSLYEMGFYASDSKAPKYRFGFDAVGDGADAAAAATLMTGDANHGRVVAMVTVSWTQGEGSSAVDVSKTFTYSKDYMSDYLLSPFTKSFAITLSGMSSVGGVKARPMFAVLDDNGSVVYTFAGPVWNIA